MPGYEMALVMRAMKKPDLISAVKRTLTYVLDHGGVVKRIESLGERQLPYRMRHLRENFTQGHYFVVDFVAAPSMLTLLKDHQYRDIDVIRQGIRKIEDPLPETPCKGVYSDLHTGGEVMTRHMMMGKKKKGGPKWPNVDKLD